MALDGSDIENLEAARATFAEDVGEIVFGKHPMVSVKDGFPPGTYSAINPATYRDAIVSGDIAMEETLFAAAQVALEAAHGPAQAPNYTQQFSASASPADQTLTATFDMNMRPV